MKTFSEIYQLACLHKGGEDAVEGLLPTVCNDEELNSKSDDYYLSNMSRRVFRAGLKHAMVDKKWPGFDAAFKHFDPFYCAMLSEDDIDAAMKNKAIIRHRGKLLSIRANAQFVIEQSREYGGFGAYLTHWAPDQTLLLWWDLKKKGKHLGGASGPSFLRMVGKDSFLLTRDVVAVLKNNGVIAKEPTSKADLREVQKAFLTWQAECGRPLSEISRIVSFTAT